jgi:hypothetical protein
MEVRIARMDMRVKSLEREMGEIKDDLKIASKEMAETATEIKLVSQELRAAIAQAVSSAAKPFDRLAWGWKALVGIGSIILGVLAAAGGIMTLMDRFK